MVVVGSERDGEDQRRSLEEAFLTYLGKLRGFHVEKKRRGQKPVRLVRHYEFELDDTVAKQDQAAELAETAWEVAADDAGDASQKQKYEVVLLGEALATKQPELARIPLSVEPQDTPAPTRESELIRALQLSQDFCNNVMREFLNLAKAAPSLVNANAKTAAELGVALATSTTTQHEWEYKKAQLEAEARISLEEVRGRVERSDRMWTTFDHFFEELAPYFDVAAAEFTRAGGGPDKGAPTPEELDAIFGAADPDLAALAKRFVSSKGQEAEALRTALQGRWDALSEEQRQAVMQAFSKLDKKRVFAIGLWMKRNNIGQQKRAR